MVEGARESKIYLIFAATQGEGEGRGFTQGEGKGKGALLKMLLGGGVFFSYEMAGKCASESAKKRKIKK